MIHGQLMELKKLCGNIFHKPLRDSISETEKFIQDVNERSKSFVLKTVLQPFFDAMQEEKKQFQNTVLDCFYKVFHQATSEFYPDKSLTHDIISLLVQTDLAANDDLNLKCCNVCIACLRSKSGIRYAHGGLLRKMFKLLFKIYNLTENPASLTTIETSINESLLAIFSAYDEPIEVPSSHNLNDFTRVLANTLVEHSLSIIRFLNGVINSDKYYPTIRDVDMFAVISFISSIIENNKMKLQTIRLAANFLIFALRQQCRFYSTPAFRSLLQTQLHVAFLSLALDSRLQLAEPTADILKIVWNRFAGYYTEGLNEVFVKGLLISLTSPDPQVLYRTFSVFKFLSQEPQLFVDCFINYDCDQSGYFQNVFENTVLQIEKLSFPDTKHTVTQKQALSLLVTILGSLWQYFNNFEKKEEAAEPEAPQNFLDAKKAKDVFNQGIEIFKRSFKKGIAFLIEHSVIENEPMSIAKFLYSTPSLDPISVGEVIGGSSEQSKNVLRCFANCFDFRGLTFEQAFRSFLSKFQIPGEAQMIDRIMEQFGTKFYIDNPTLFSCADTVYVLAFSTLMLHTDAHHPNVKRRMTLEEFIANNKAIDGGKDLSYNLLEDLYRGITSEKIFLSQSAVPNSALLTRAQRADLYKSQCSSTIAQAKKKSQMSINKTWHRSESPLYIGPMFQEIWGGALAALTMTFEQSNDPEIYKTCLEGLSLSVHIASHCFIESALDTLVDSFAKFTNLRKTTREFKSKNIDCTNFLLKIAMEDRHFLRGAWEIVMGEISAIEKLKENTSFDYNFEIIDDLFTSTSSLDRESLVDFIGAVCSVSKQELNEVPQRQYLLQKLSIVAHYNMKRPRFIWMAIWDIIGSHLKYAGCSIVRSNAEVAIDIIRQLASKFLAQQELTQFHFQQHFLLPFLQIFEQQNDKVIKELVLTCISVLLCDTASQFQSGWIVVFQILTIASLDTFVQQAGFVVVEQLMSKALDVLSPNVIHVVSILCSYVLNAINDDIRVKAVSYFNDLSSIIEISDLDSWSSVLQAVSQCSSSDNLDVRRQSYRTFLAIITELVKNSSSNEKLWRTIFVETIPEFFNDQATKAKDDMYYSSTIEFLGKLNNEIIPEYWSILGDYFKYFIHCLEKPVISINEGLSYCSLYCLQKLINNKFSILDDDQLSSLADSLNQISFSIQKISTNNANLYIQILSEIRELDHENKFSSHLYRILKKIDTGYQLYLPSEDSNIIWANANQVLLSVLYQNITVFENDLLNHINHILLLYPSVIKSQFYEWSLPTISAIEMLNGFDEPLFKKAFLFCKSNITPLIMTNSTILQRHLSELFSKWFSTNI